MHSAMQIYERTGSSRRIIQEHVLFPQNRSILWTCAFFTSGKFCSRQFCITFRLIILSLYSEKFDILLDVCPSTFAYQRKDNVLETLDCICYHNNFYSISWILYHQTVIGNKFCRNDKRKEIVMDTSEPPTARIV